MTGQQHQPTASFVAASNRLPVEVAADGSVAASPGGLASALSALADDTAWVGWAGPSAPRLEPFTMGRTDLHPVPLSQGEVSRYYAGFANSVLWPLFHGRLQREVFDRTWWRTYRVVNERFARTIAKVAAPGATVWVHDYHLLLVPRLLRSRRPDLRIGLFVHTPFPNSQLFSMLPWRDDVLLGMLGADLVGFQVQDDADNFAAGVERVLGLTASDGRVGLARRTVEVGAHPISIDFSKWERLGFEAAAAAAARRTELGVEVVLLGIDRLDYTKGITHRLQAFAELLDDGRLQPDHCAFVQVAVPSRAAVPAYREERHEVAQWIERIHTSHPRADGSSPVHYSESALDDRAVAEWYRAADVLVVTSLADGMNLVAKEYVAASVDDEGVLVLSEFAGAAHDLPEALIVNPYDIDGIKSAMLAAIAMPADERRRRMARMREQLRRHDVHRWAQGFLDRLGAVPGRRARWHRWVPFHQYRLNGAHVAARRS